MEILIGEVRALIEDFLRKGKELFSYDSDNIFPLTENNIIEDSGEVYRNGIKMTSGYSIDYNVNKVTITDSLDVGDNVEIRYNYYLHYSDTEIQEYINGALIYLSINNIGAQAFEIISGEIYPTPKDRQRRLIAIISAILIKPNLSSYVTPDFSIRFTTNESKDVKIKKTIRDYKRRLGIFSEIDIKESYEWGE